MTDNAKETQMPEHLLKMFPEDLLMFVDGELLGMVWSVDFSKNTVYYKEYDSVSQQLINKTKTGELVFAINKNTLKKQRLNPCAFTTNAPIVPFKAV